MYRRLLLLLLTVALAGVLGFVSFTPSLSVKLVSVAGYWIILVTSLSFGWVLIRSFRGNRDEVADWRSWRAPVALTILAAAFLHLHEHHEFKVVADEVVLALTAKQMHFGRDAFVVVRGYDYVGDFTPMATFIDKRPLVFPFLLASIHDLTGYRPENVFFLNAGLSLLLLLILLLIGRRIGGWGAGLASVLLLTSIPMLAQNACGGGFEILNLVMIVLTLWLGMRAAELPSDNDRLSAFVLSGVLLAQVRYESVLFLLPVACGVAYLWYRQRSFLLPWPVLAAPLLLVLIPLQYNVFKLTEATWQLNDIAGADKPFGFRYFYDNVGHALNFFLNTDGTEPNSWLLTVLGPLGVGFFILILYRRHRDLFGDKPAAAMVCIFLIGLLAHTGLMLCYFWGHWDDPLIWRLSLPAHLLLVLALVFAWPDLVSHRRRWTILCGITALFIVSVTAPRNAMHRFTQRNLAARATNWIGEHIRTLGGQSALAVDRSSGLQWFLYDKSSITSQAIVGRPDAFILHFRNHTFQNYFLVQQAMPEITTGARLVDANDAFGDALKLQLIEERSFAPFYLVRLSRIVAIDEEKLKAWASQRKEHPIPSTIKEATTAAKSQENDLATWLRQLP